jgi:hypothetical protein
LDAGQMMRLRALLRKGQYLAQTVIQTAIQEPRT